MKITITITLSVIDRHSDIDFLQSISATFPNNECAGEWLYDMDERIKEILGRANGEAPWAAPHRVSPFNPVPEITFTRE